MIEHMFAPTGVVDVDGSALSDGPRGLDGWSVAAALAGRPALSTPAAGGAPECPSTRAEEQGCWEWLDDPHADDWWIPDAMAELGVGTVRSADEATAARQVAAVVRAAPVDEEPSASAPAWWESAELLERALPGSGLARLLELAGPERLDDAALVESVAAWERLAAWAHLGAAVAAGELSHRAAMNPLWQA